MAVLIVVEGEEIRLLTSEMRQQAHMVYTTEVVQMLLISIFTPLDLIKVVLRDESGPNLDLVKLTQYDGKSRSCQIRIDLEIFQNVHMIRVSTI